MGFRPSCLTLRGTKPQSSAGTRKPAGECGKSRSSSRLRNSFGSGPSCLTSCKGGNPQPRERGPGSTSGGSCASSRRPGRNHSAGPPPRPLLRRLRDQRQGRRAFLQRRLGGQGQGQRAFPLRTGGLLRRARAYRSPRAPRPPPLGEPAIRARAHQLRGRRPLRGTSGPTTCRALRCGARGPTIGNRGALGTGRAHGARITSSPATSSARPATGNVGLGPFLLMTTMGLPWPRQ